jgi:alpha-D-ribose 1-methylphosphonate 5-triphosphate synthase subunit PhnI
MGILDRAMRSPEYGAPANDAEFVLYHTEGIEAMGFTNHLKLPHYVTFQASLSNVREAVRRDNANAAAAAENAASAVELV